jgi:hypothetical protein
MAVGTIRAVRRLLEGDSAGRRGTAGLPDSPARVLEKGAVDEGHRGTYSQRRDGGAKGTRGNKAKKSPKISSEFQAFGSSF